MGSSRVIGIVACLIEVEQCEKAGFLVYFIDDIHEQLAR